MFSDGNDGLDITTPVLRTKYTENHGLRPRPVTVPHVTNDYVITRSGLRPVGNDADRISNRIQLKALPYPSINSY
jgi:hypothetical protein